MKAKLAKAVDHFYGTQTSLELIYFEAVANSMDAGATDIQIKIEIDEFNKPETLKIKIIDNGRGFNNKNFEKFCNLFDTDEIDHKGLGRLVYLQYFKNVSVESNFNQTKRTFKFNKRFTDKKSDAKTTESPLTTLSFSDYSKLRIHQQDYLCPETICKNILNHFYPRLYGIKDDDKDLKVKVSLKIGNSTAVLINSNDELNVSELPTLKVKPVQGLDAFQDIKIAYSIKPLQNKKVVFTSICTDNRTLPFDIIPEESIPDNYEVFILIYSDYFTGKSDPTRQKLNIQNHEMKQLKTCLSEAFKEILIEEIPSIAKTNKIILEKIDKRYPHLQGYFRDDTIGLVDVNKALEKAQKKFFLDQRKILEADELDDDLYEKSLNISSRLLTEYIIYRALTIKRLSELDFEAPENSFHKSIIPMRETFDSKTKNDDLFINNAWLLDEKYMNYTKILSDQEMNELIDVITDGEDKENYSGRPDIAIVFSDELSEDSKCDVVIVELKKKDVALAKKEEVISQLRQRGRRLLNHYGTKIQRIWFYGVVDFDDEFEDALDELGYTELFSFGKHYYGEIDIKSQLGVKVPTAVNLLDYNALIRDAEKRNQTFLDVLKAGIKSSI